MESINNLINRGQVKTITWVNRQVEKMKNTNAECLHLVTKVYIAQNPNNTHPGME